MRIPFTKPGGAEHPHTIRLKLRDMSQLFNSMDPSPFIEKDLDDDAEEFIVSSAQEYPANSPLKLRVLSGETRKGDHGERAASVHGRVPSPALVSCLRAINFATGRNEIVPAGADESSATLGN